MKWNVTRVLAYNTEELQIQVMDMRKTLLGAEHPDTLTSIADLAKIYWNQRRWNKAEQLQIQVMDRRKNLLGAEHPHTLLYMENLACTYRDQGKICVMLRSWSLKS